MTPISSRWTEATTRFLAIPTHSWTRSKSSPPRLPLSVEDYIRSSVAIIGMNFDDRLDRVDTPTMVIAGELDRPTPPERMKLYFDNIAGAQMAVIPGAGHFPFAHQPDAFNRTLRGFLDSLDSQQRSTTGIMPVITLDRPRR